MKIAIFGATGGTGRQIIHQALAQSHYIQALVRDPARLPIDHPNLVVVQGDVLDPIKVESVIQGSEAVIVTLGTTANNPDDIVSRGTAAVVEGMKRAGVKRLIAVTSIGVGDSKDQVPLAFKMLMKTILKKPMEDKERQEGIIKASGMDWTIVRPGGLTDGPATGQYSAGLDPKIMAGQVSRADVAGFVLEQLEDETYLYKTPAIT